ncbi:MAG: alr [Cryobacterium sp.]|jgi:alanine racemase|nr:alr [Cryobacterium sp.]
MSGFREATVSLTAIARNVATLQNEIGAPHTMAVVKANGYGHGSVPVARAALAAGADWLGVADIEEARELRDAGIDAPILAWLHGPEADFGHAVARDVDLGVSSPHQLLRAARAAEPAGRPASVHLKLETGLSRNGVSEPDWEDFLALASRLQREGRLRVRGIFSHLSNTSPADDAEAIRSFDRGRSAAAQAGLDPELVHLAASAAALRIPQCRYSMVRLGIALYGLSPFADSAAEIRLEPAMTLRAQVAAVRSVPAGAGVSYDYTWRAPGRSNLALVPLGYADGIPRQASGAAGVSIDHRPYPVVGRIAMDQFVVNLGQSQAAVGDEVVLFGDPATGVPSASDWAEAAGTINYDIVTRIGRRVPRVYVSS